jgi:hypothetical protein
MPRAEESPQPDRGALSDSDSKQQIDALNKQISAHPGYRRYGDCEALHRNTPEPAFDTSVRLDNSSLLKFDGWDSNTKAFIRAAGESLDLSTVLTKHYEPTGQS